MMKAWPQKTLGEVAEFINGRAFKPNDWSLTGVPIIRIQNLTDRTAPINRFNGDYAERHSVIDGDLLVSWSATLDVYVWDGGDAVLNQHIFRVIPDSSVISKSFLYYALKSVMDELRSKTHGATMKHITKGPFEKTRIPVPPLPEQDRIVRLLDEADELQKLRARADNLTTKLVPAIFHEMFGDPASNSMDWPLQPLSRISTCLDGQRIPVKEEDRQTRTGTVPYYGANGQVGWIDDAIFNEPLLLIAEDGGHFDEPERGVAYTIHGPAWVNNHAHVIRPDEKSVLLEYLHHYFKHFNFLPYITGTTRAKLTQKDLMRVEVCIPPLSLQSGFVLLANEISKLKTDQASSRLRLEDLFQSLLHNAFNGGL